MSKGLRRHGFCFSPINLYLVASEVAYIVHDCDADMVFYTRKFAQNVAIMRASAPTVKAAPPDAKAPQHSRL